MHTSNQQQVTVAFKAAEKHLPNTPEKAYFANSEERQMLFFFKFPKIESGRLYCTKPACKV